MTVKDELTAKYPKLAARAKTSPLRALRMFCLECMGGSPVDVKACTAPECTLYPFRLGKLPLTDEQRQSLREQALSRRGFSALERANSESPGAGRG